MVDGDGRGASRYPGVRQGSQAAWAVSRVEARVVRHGGSGWACAAASPRSASTASGGSSSQRWRPLQADGAPRHRSPGRLSASPPLNGMTAPPRKALRPAGGSPHNISTSSRPQRLAVSARSSWRLLGVHRRCATDGATDGRAAEHLACVR